MPADLKSAGHIDTPLPAEITFGDRARARGRTSPAWDAAARSCSGVYCHGDASPSWDAPRGTGATCGTCHTLPPESHNAFGLPPDNDCRLCHASAITPDGTMDPARHPNGAVDGD